eukprot:6319675-Karenia_brevis.AAC.1
MVESMPGYISCKLCSEAHRSHHVMALHIVQEHAEWGILDIDSLYIREGYMRALVWTIGPVHLPNQLRMPPGMLFLVNVACPGHGISSHSTNTSARHITTKAFVAGTCARRQSG